VTPEVQIGLSVTMLPDRLLFDESGGIWLAAFPAPANLPLYGKLP
jgi:hypothetical protein